LAEKKMPKWSTDKPSRWYRSIDDRETLIAFRNHLWAVYQMHSSDREFPGTIRVAGACYSVVKEKVYLERKRRIASFRDAGLYIALGSTSLVSSLFLQTFGIVSEVIEDSGNELRKAASVVAGNYYKVLDDTGKNIELEFVWHDDNHYADMPSFY
jgi:hypothetical protein